MDNSICRVIAFLDSQSSIISAGCWDNTLPSDSSARAITIVWWFQGCFFRALLKSCTSALQILRWDSLVDTIHRDQRLEQSLRVVWVLILICIPSEALFIIFFFISLEFIRGFHWLGPRVNLPVLHTCTCFDLVMNSVSNGSKFPGRFRFRFHPNPDRGNGSYHTKNPAFQHHNFASN